MGARAALATAATTASSSSGPAAKIVTPVPGPKTTALLERRKRTIATGLSTLHPVFIEKAHGPTVTDVDGNTYIDFAGGIGVMNVGHTNAEVVAAVQQQAARLTHSSIQVLGYQQYIEVAEGLLRLSPNVGRHFVPEGERVFLVTTGTEAVENAVKLARLYTKRQAIVVFEHAFHGRSFGGMSLTSKYAPYKKGYGPFLSEIYRLPYPYHYRQGVTPAKSLEMMKERIEEFLKTHVGGAEIAAFLVETVPGEGGFLVPPPGFLEHLREVATREKSLLILDEVQSGFGRTGKMWGVQHFPTVRPDLISCAKSIAGGFPLAAVFGRADVMNCGEGGALGGTYGGNPVACAAAIQVIQMMEKGKLLEQGTSLAGKLEKRLREMQKKRPLIGDVRGLGAMQAIELVTDQKTREPAAKETTALVNGCRSRGLILLPTGTYSNVIRFHMPLNISDSVLNEALDILDDELGKIKK